MARHFSWVMSLMVFLAACRSPAPIVVMPPPTSEPTDTPTPMRVYVSGAVISPGVYPLPHGSIGDDALKAAGGAAADADLERVNLAHELSDQEHFYVPHKSEPAVSQPGASTPASRVVASTPALPSPININTATAQELDQLPGIGPTIAQRIVDFRQLHGRFAQIEDLLQVQGIGRATLDQIEGMIAVGE
ncbi:MAG: helix-hairpin-helix domain-containing protein [Thermoflexales bacterium]|nr:helix-hairpin-helix domain-containing protein [Thermoflexales bacterium]